MTLRVLSLNPGSSSLKATVRADTVETTIGVDRLGSPNATLTIDGRARPFTGDLTRAVTVIADRLKMRHRHVDAVAYRVVHGGPHLSAPTVIDDDVMATLEDVVALAPLHLPGALELIRAGRRRWPGANHVACFDTAFFRDLPPADVRLPLPREVTDLGFRRYGFHGLSVQSVLRAHHDLGDAVIAHLGSGCSVSAVDAAGRPQHTTMSYSPTSGMVSGTRPGDLDPEVVLQLIEHHGYSVERLRELFNHASGLAGITGGRHDMRDLHDDALGALAIEVFVRSASMAIAACATVLDDWRTLVFTGGVGEHDAEIRTRILSRVRPPTWVQVLVVAADEERVLDDDARTVLQQTTTP